MGAADNGSHAAGTVRVGIGGWTYAPWRGSFFPPGLPHTQELRHASRRVTAIEVNGTFYSLFDACAFARWRDETPDGFRFSLKAHRATTQRRDPAQAAEAIERFLGSGLQALGDKLGPIVWPWVPTRAFDAAQVAAFLALLPRSVGSRPLQHVLDVRHPSFDTPAFFELLRRHGCSAVHTDSPKWAALADAQAPLAYLRLMRSRADLPTGYPPSELDGWATGARAWAATGRDAWVFFINGDKERAPAAALALLERLGGSPGW